MPRYKKEAINQLKRIRNTGDFNMFTDYKLIMEHASEQKMCSLVSYVQDNPEKYIELLGLI